MSRIPEEPEDDVQDMPEPRVETPTLPAEGFVPVQPQPEAGSNWLPDLVTLKL